MSTPSYIAATTLVGRLCVSADDGQQLHDRIAELLKERRSVVVSFAGVDTIISAFLNAAIGQLYGEFSEEMIRAHLSVTGMEADDLELLRRVIENAKVYFANRKSFDEVWSDGDTDGQ